MLRTGDVLDCLTVIHIQTACNIPSRQQAFNLCAWKGWGSVRVGMGMMGFQACTAVCQLGNAR